MNRESKGKVFVGLSGGVDSAVSAALLKEQGYDVTGVFIKVWQPDFLPCNWREERRDAMRVALALDIPFLFFDFEEEYKKGVIDYMLREYKAGRTPNPDVLCNREIKFGAFWNKAKELGADFIATGHYARISSSAAAFKKSSDVASQAWPDFSRAATDTYTLLEGKDKDKDQSYFLWTLTQSDLEHTLFPVGGFLKSEVREFAEKFRLPVAEKKDSQGICFLGDVGMDEFLSHFVRAEEGKVLDSSGKHIGIHKGAIFYTIGERHGFDITKKSPSSGPYYVVAKDMKENTITVSDSPAEISALSPKKAALTGANWISEPEESDGISARIRYRSQKIPTKLLLEGKRLAVEFESPVRGLSFGQSIVFYKGEEVLGGAILDKAIS